MSTVAILSWVWFGFTSLMTLLMWAAQVNPDQAVFNLYHWARKCGIKDPPQWLRDRATDRKVRVGAYIALLVLAFFGGILFDNWLRPLTAEFPPTAAQSLSNKRIYFASDIDARIKAVDRLDAILVRFQPILMQSQEFWNRIRYMIQDGSASELLLKYANDTKPILEDLDAAILEYRLRFPELEKAINSPDYPYVRSIYSSSLNLRSEIAKWAGQQNAIQTIQNTQTYAEWDKAIHAVQPWLEKYRQELALLRQEYERAEVYKSG